MFTRVDAYSVFQMRVHGGAMGMETEKGLQKGKATRNTKHLLEETSSSMTVLGKEGFRLLCLDYDNSPMMHGGQASQARVKVHKIWHAVHQMFVLEL